MTSNASASAPGNGRRRHGTTVYLGLGSNLGARRAFLLAAVAAMGAREGIVNARVSKLYETDAVTDEAQPAYLNAVLRGQTPLTAPELLELCSTIEAGLGRVRPRDGRKVARPIDIDILLYGAEVVDLPKLQIPHPRMLERPFVLIPLADVAEPGLLHPLTGTDLTKAEPSPQVLPFETRGEWPA